MNETFILPRPTARPRSAAARAPAPAGEPSLWAALPGLGLLAADDQRALGALLRERTVGAGQAVFAAGDAAPALVLLVEGCVALGLRNGSQALRAERIVHAPAWLDLASALTGGRHEFDAQAQSAARIGELPCGALHELLADRPALAAGLLAALAHELRRLMLQAHELMHKDAPGRLAGWLADHCTHEGERCTVLLTERKRDIASQLGMTPETLSRLMRHFIDEGLVRVEGYTVHVLDCAALHRTAAG